jgi:hypothetical protein
LVIIEFQGGSIFDANPGSVLNANQQHPGFMVAMRFG